MAFHNFSEPIGAELKQEILTIQNWRTKIQLLNCYKFVEIIFLGGGFRGPPKSYSLKTTNSKSSRFITSVRARKTRKIIVIIQ